MKTRSGSDHEKHCFRVSFSTKIKEEALWAVIDLWLDLRVGMEK